MTVYDVKGRGKQKGISLQWRVGEYRIEFLPKKTRSQCHQAKLPFIWRNKQDLFINLKVKCTF
jgi:hypothetical protein